MEEQRNEMAADQFFVHLAYHSLEICLWVPVRVIDDDNICCGQVDTQTPSSGTQHEQELLTVWGIECIYRDLEKQTSLFDCTNVCPREMKNLNRTVNN